MKVSRQTDEEVIVRTYKHFFPPLVSSNVIYKYSCSGCNATYYGETSRNLKIRCYEHLGINKSGGNCALSSSSSIWDHNKHSIHVGTPENFSIISKTDNSFDLSIHESLLQRDRSNLHSQQSISMVLFYFSSCLSHASYFIAPLFSLEILFHHSIILILVAYHFVFLSVIGFPSTFIPSSCFLSCWLVLRVY